MDFPHTIGKLTIRSAQARVSGALSFEAALTGREDQSLLARRIPESLVESMDAQALSARIGDLLQLGGAANPGIVHSDHSNEGWWVAECAAEGITLSDILASLRQRGRPCPPRLLLSFACDLCTQVESLHSRPGLVSGSEHVLHLHLTPDAIVFPLDPGPTRLRAPGWAACPVAMDSSHRIQHSLTLDFLAPEQTEPNRKVGKEADLFAIGSILVACITGRPPFASVDAVSSIQAIREADLTGIEKDLDAFVPGLLPILQRTLARSPNKRYSRAFALREDLRGLMARFDHGNLALERQRFLEQVLAPMDELMLDRGGKEQDPAGDPGPSEATLPINMQETLSLGSAEQTGPFEQSIASDRPTTDASTVTVRGPGTLRAAAFLSLLVAFICAAGVLVTFLA